MNIKKGSSVWQLGTFNGLTPLSTNFCVVFWTSVVSMLALVTVVGLGSWFIGDLSAALWAFFMTGELMGTARFLVLVAIIVIGAVLLYFTVILLGVLGLKTIKVVTTNEDSFIRTTYRSWKDKYCPTVTEVK